MAPKQNKRKRGSSSKDRAGKQREDLSDLPQAFLQDVKTIISSLKENGEELPPDSMIVGIKQAFEQKLKLEAVDSSEIMEFLRMNDNSYDALESLAAKKYRQQVKAERVFRLLDEAGKGVIVLQDLKRVSEEMLGQETTDDELMEMMQEVDQSGDGILSKQDMIRIARQVGL